MKIDGKTVKQGDFDVVDEMVLSDKESVLVLFKHEDNSYRLVGMGHPTTTAMEITSEVIDKFLGKNGLTRIDGVITKKV